MNQRNKVSVMVMVPKADRDFLFEWARARGLSVSETCRRIISEAIRVEKDSRIKEPKRLIDDPGDI